MNKSTDTIYEFEARVAKMMTELSPDMGPDAALRGTIGCIEEVFGVLMGAAILRSLPDMAISDADRLLAEQALENITPLLGQTMIGLMYAAHQLGVEVLGATDIQVEHLRTNEMSREISRKSNLRHRSRKGERNAHLN